MSLALNKLRTSFLAIPLAETTFARRGFFIGNPSAQARFESIGQTFVYGYNATLEDDDLTALVDRLEHVESDLRGFAYEGAAMALALLDFFSPWKRRLSTFLAGAGRAHVYMVHVGLGWTFGRLPRRRDALLSQFDPLLRWLALDGYGFHEGYFHWERMFKQKAYTNHLKGYEQRAFDQGLGRSLWFVECATVSRVAKSIADFPVSRQQDLWSGVGLASTYAGGGHQDDLFQLLESAGPYRVQLAQGAAFAAKARQRAGNPMEHTNMACRVICGLSADEAADITDKALQDLPVTQDIPAYEVWRQRIQAQFVVPVSGSL